MLVSNSVTDMGIHTTERFFMRRVSDYNAKHFEKLGRKALFWRKAECRERFLGEQVRYRAYRYRTRQDVKLRFNPKFVPKIEGVASVEDVRIRQGDVTYFMSDGVEIPRDNLLEWEVVR